MNDLSDPQLAGLIEDHLAAYGPDVGADVGATPEAIRAVVRAIERTWDLVIPDRLLEQARDRTELVWGCVAQIRRQLRLRARRNTLPASANLRVRVEPPDGYRGHGITRGGPITAYDAEELVEGALRWGPGARIDFILGDEDAARMVDALVDRASALGNGTLRVSVRRSASR